MYWSFPVNTGCSDLNTVFDTVINKYMHVACRYRKRQIYTNNIIRALNASSHSR